MDDHTPNRLGKRQRTSKVTGQRSPVTLNIPSWASHDADLLDNFRATKRFATQSVASEFDKCFQEPSSSDIMLCSSAECSPAPFSASHSSMTPLPMKCSPVGLGARTGPSPMNMADRLPPSPTERDGESELDLRRATLMKLFHLKAGTDDVVEDEKAPMCLHRAVVDRQPVVGRKPSRLALEQSDGDHQTTSP